jgi:hypothetical protein
MTLHDKIFDKLLAVAIGLSLGALMFIGCAPAPGPVDAGRALPDLPARLSRVVVARVDGQTCIARLPLAVATTSTAADLLEPTLAAGRVWSDAFGFDVIVPARRVRPTLVVTVSEPLDHAPDRLGQCEQRCVDGVFVQTIRLFVVNTPALADILTHELGHALGADGDADQWGHSSNSTSIMFATLPTDAERAGRKRVLPSDVAALRRVWSLP